jgi:hypothetical protein
MAMVTLPIAAVGAADAFVGTNGDRGSAELLSFPRTIENEQPDRQLYCGDKDIPLSLWSYWPQPLSG